MTIVKLHENEVETDTDLVKRLLEKQFPQWADLSIDPVSSSGTDNALYRLGRDKLVRLPKIDWAIGQVEKEHYWMPKLAPQLPFSLPKPLVMGKPDAGYPWKWSIYQWLEGKNVGIDEISNPIQAAKDLASFIVALQKIDTLNGPPAIENKLRGASLKLRDTNTLKAISDMREMIDADLAIEIWKNALRAPEWEGEPVWFHGDLLPGNLIFEKGQLKAVIDFGGLGIGDPACDMIIAWGLFKGESREAFRLSLNVDDATWERGRGHALSQAVIFIPYYLNTNPVGVKVANHTINEIFAEYEGKQ